MSAGAKAVAAVIVACGAIALYLLARLYSSAMSYAEQPNPFYASWAIGAAFAQIAVILMLVLVLAALALLMEVRRK